MSRSYVRLTEDEIKVMDLVLAFEEKDMQKEIGKLIKYEKILKKFIKIMHEVLHKQGLMNPKHLKMKAEEIKSAKDKYYHQLEHLHVEKEMMMGFAKNHKVKHELQRLDHYYHVHLDPNSEFMNFVNTKFKEKKIYDAEMDKLVHKIESLAASVR